MGVWIGQQQPVRTPAGPGVLISNIYHMIAVDDLWWTVPVPAGLVSDGSIPAGGRYLFMVLADQCGETDECRLSVDQIAAISGIRSRRAVRRWISRLVADGWLGTSRSPGPHPTLYKVKRFAEAVAVPVGLIRHRYLSPSAKCIYATILSLLPGRSRSCTLTQAQLARAAGLGSRTTVHSLVKELQGAGWLRVSRRPQHRCYTYEPLDPHLAQREEAWRRAKNRLERAEFLGEALMKEMLNVLVADDRFQDNARPGFLKNPLTDEFLEFDRWYFEAGVAFEFNGPQHYGTTRGYPDPAEVRMQRARDLIKAALVREQRIQLIILTAADLTFDVLIDRIGDRLPRRELRLEDPVVRELEALSRSYVHRARLYYF